MRSLLRLAPLALFALPFFACSSNKNYDERKAAAAADPDYVPPFDQSLEKNAYTDAAKTYPIGAGRKDPGSKAVDVAAAEKGSQFAWMWDAPSEAGLARATFTYDDNTPQFVIPFRDPSNTGYGWGGWEPLADPTDATWQSPTVAAAVVDPAGRLKSAWRFRGGPFTEYGGGVGISLRTVSNSTAMGVTVPRSNPSIQLLEQPCTPGAPGCTISQEFPEPTAGAYDLSSWDGLAIWVRRGPDGQDTMRIAITERNSAEDLNSSAVRTISTTLDDPSPTGIVEGKYCRRWRLCGCAAGTPCSVVPGELDEDGAPVSRCFDPAIHTPTLVEASDFIKYPHCGVSRCKLDKNASTLKPDRDPLFEKKSCNSFVESNGHSEMFCYDPETDPPPPSKRERCGNPFQRPINVSLDWQLIKVPFKDLRQADEAQVANDMDLKSVKQIAFTYTGGWIDFWVANIGFYRKLPQ